MATIASLCKVPRRNPGAVAESLRDAIRLGVYDGSDLLARVQSGASSIESEAERMIREELEQAAANAGTASVLVGLPTVRRRKGSHLGATAPKRRAESRGRKAPSGEAAGTAGAPSAGAVVVAESVKGARPVVVPIRPDVEPGPVVAADPVGAYLSRLVYGPKREYCAALIEGRPVDDPGTEWARKVRERLRGYGLEV